jgi:hypothetical protein
VKGEVERGRRERYRRLRHQGSWAAMEGNGGTEEHQFSLQKRNKIKEKQRTADPTSIIVLELIALLTSLRLTLRVTGSTGME